MMRNTDLLNAPLRAMRSNRVDTKRVLTSSIAGRVIPLAAVPLLREDAVQSGVFNISIEMEETAERLLNGIHVHVQAHFVPFLAFDRFSGMDSFNKSYAGLPPEEGADVVPFFTRPVRTGFNTDQHNFYRVIGMHPQITGEASEPNGAFLEAYNEIINHRRKMRSQSLPLRAPNDEELARAFWHHTTMQHIVPDWDQASMEGDVPLVIADQLLPVRGIGTETALLPDTGSQDTRETDGTVRQYFTEVRTDTKRMKFETNQSGVPQIFAELESSGIRLSLSNIELAKQTRAFAEMRANYQGHDDEYIIDLLMSGVRVPEQAMKQPMLLAEQHTMFGYSQRYATNGDDLEKSVTTGQTNVSLRMRTPPMNTGGIVMITAEITPEQLFERQRDYFLHNSSVDVLPEYTRDYLDPEKVSIVPNSHVDVSHSDPDATFGYAPLNHEWVRNAPNIGGKYYRPDVNTTFDEDRQKIWAVETVDPTLTEDFYLCTDMHNKVFSDTEGDNFEFACQGNFVITGNTVFGRAIREASDEYSDVIDTVDTQRILKEE